MPADVGVAGEEEREGAHQAERARLADQLDVDAPGTGGGQSDGRHGDESLPGQGDDRDG